MSIFHFANSSLMICYHKNAMDCDLFIDLNSVLPVSPDLKVWLVVWSPPKNMKVSWDHYLIYEMENKIHVPNHQPVMVWSKLAISLVFFIARPRRSLNTDAVSDSPIRLQSHIFDDRANFFRPPNTNSLDIWTGLKPPRRTARCHDLTTEGYHRYIIHIIAKNSGPNFVHKCAAHRCAVIEAHQNRKSKKYEQMH